VLRNILNELHTYHEQLITGEENNPLILEYSNKAFDEKSKRELLYWLYEQGFHAIYIAQADGGKRANWLHCWSHVVLATRLNINVMPSVMYSIGPLLLLEFFASKQQYLSAVEDLMQGEQYCFGLSERTTGTALGETQSYAKKSDNGWQVNGVKGPIGWSDKTKQMLALVKTDEAGPTSLSFLRLPMLHSNVSTVNWDCLGMKGQTFGEVTFNNVEVLKNELIGERGKGLEYTLIIQQFVKFMSTAASVGGSQDIVRKVALMTLKSQHGRCLSDYSHVRYLLAKSTAQLLRMEATSMVCACLANAPIAQMSIISSIAKHTALQETQHIIEQLKDIMSVKGVIDMEPLFGSYRKVVDDLEMVRYIDTNPVVNLQNIASQLSLVFTQRERLTPEKGIQQLTQLRELLNPTQAFFAPEKAKLSVTNSRGDLLVNAIKTLADEALAKDMGVIDFHPYCVKLNEQLLDVWQRFSAIEQGSDYASAQRIEFARRYSNLVSIAAVVLLNISSEEQLLPFPIVQSVVDLLLTEPDQIPDNCAQLFTHLENTLTQKLALSWFPVPLTY